MNKETGKFPLLEVRGVKKYFPIKKGFFRIIRNEKDKRSIFILPSVITIKTFEGFIDRRDIMYKGI